MSFAPHPRFTTYLQLSQNTRTKLPHWFSPSVSCTLSPPSSNFLVLWPPFPCVIPFFWFRIIPTLTLHRLQQRIRLIQIYTLAFFLALLLVIASGFLRTIAHFIYKASFTIVPADPILKFVQNDVIQSCTLLAQGEDAVYVSLLNLSYNLQTLTTIS